MKTNNNTFFFTYFVCDEKVKKIQGEQAWYRNRNRLARYWRYIEGPDSRAFLSQFPFRVKYLKTQSVTFKKGLYQSDTFKKSIFFRIFRKFIPSRISYWNFKVGSQIVWDWQPFEERPLAGQKRAYRLGAGIGADVLGGSIRIAE